MIKPGETLLFEFLAATVEAAAAPDVLADAEVLDTQHAKITGNKGAWIWDGESELVPGPGGPLKEFDCDTIIACYAAVPKDTPRERLAARDLAFNIAAKFIAAMNEDQTLGGRVCDVLIGSVSRHYTNIGTKSFAVSNIAILINPSGERAA